MIFASLLQKTDYWNEYKRTVNIENYNFIIERNFMRKKMYILSVALIVPIFDTYYTLPTKKVIAEAIVFGSLLKINSFQ